jgi:signal transduction histidine kinase
MIQAGTDSLQISQKKETILTLWEERCLKEVVSAEPTASLALRNSIPIYLDHLAEALATNRRIDFKSLIAYDEEGTRIGKLHGADRASNRSYLLSEVIFEYHILREVIFKVLEVDGPLGILQRDIVYDSLEQAVNDAAVEFSDVHSDIQQKFIYTLTHDLKNPLTAAKANADLILKRNDAPEPTLKSAKRIIASLNRLDGMIHDLLDASRIRAGEQLSIQFIECDLGEVIQAVVEEMAVIHGDRFILETSGEEKGTWGCDGLRRACENLIDNAVKYGIPSTPISVSLKHREKGIELVVHNHGAAIPESEIPNLFKEYRRAKSALEGTQPGWGLGLTLVKGVVDAHKGKILVESKEGFGTSFTLEIPYAESHATSIAGQAVSALTRSPVGSSENEGVGEAESHKGS